MPKESIYVCIWYATSIGPDEGDITHPCMCVSVLIQQSIMSNTKCSFDSASNLSHPITKMNHMFSHFKIPPGSSID